MKRLIVVLLMATLILPLAIPQALASPQISIEDADGSNEVATGDESAGDFSEEELDKIMTQDSPWYFLKRFFENVRLALTFKQNSRAELWSELAGERAKEYAALEKKYDGEDIDEDQLALLEKALKDLLEFTEEYVEHVLEDDDIEANDEEVQGDKYLQRIAHLKRVAEKAPESAQDGLARAIANAQRQRARMISRGKLYDPDIETRYYAFSKFTYKLKLADYEIEVEYQQDKDELEAKVKIEQDDLMKVELKGYKALEYLLPIFDELNVEASMPQEDIISAVLTAFAWQESYDKIEIKIDFNDGSKIDIDMDDDESDDKEPNPVVPSLPYKFFDLEIKNKNEKLEVEFDQKSNKVKAKVQIKRKESQDIHLKDDKALEYLLPILEGLELEASTPKAEVLDALLTAFAWETSYTKVKLKVQFSDGKTMDLHWKEEKPKIEEPPNSTGLPFKLFELEIESDDRELEVELELKNGKLEAKVEIEQENGRDIELKGSKALNYLQPMLNKLKLNSEMSKREIVNTLLQAFNWEGEWEELEVKIVFNNGTKTKIEIGD